LKKSGASDSEIEKALVEAEQFMELYTNLFIRFGMTMLEILPVGVVVTLISAALLRKREVLPTAAPA